VDHGIGGGIECVLIGVFFLGHFLSWQGLDDDHIGLVAAVEPIAGNDIARGWSRGDGYVLHGIGSRHGTVFDRLDWRFAPDMAALDAQSAVGVDADEHAAAISAGS
jgi:hypothetical protein